MRIAALPFLLLLPAAAADDAIRPGAWQLTSRVSDAAVPGVPGFLVNMVVKRPKVEEKCVIPDALDPGMSRLLAPNPIGKCVLERNDVADGRFVQVMTCPFRVTGPLRVVRVGSYDRTSYRADVTMTGVEKKNARIVATMEAKATGKGCKV